MRDIIINTSIESYSKKNIKNYFLTSNNEKTRDLCANKEKTGKNLHNDR